MRAVLALAIAVEVVACQRATRVNSNDLRRDERAALRESARRVLMGPCGECHVGSHANARLGALKIFNLNEVEWAARMDERQLREAVRRLNEPIDPLERPIHLTADDRATFEQFVDEEIALRRAR